MWWINILYFLLQVSCITQIIWKYHYDVDEWLQTQPEIKMIISNKFHHIENFYTSYIFILMYICKFDYSYILIFLFYIVPILDIIKVKQTSVLLIRCIFWYCSCNFIISLVSIHVLPSWLFCYQYICLYCSYRLR